MLSSQPIWQRLRAVPPFRQSPSRESTQKANYRAPHSKSSPRRANNFFFLTDFFFNNARWTSPKRRTARSLIRQKQNPVLLKKVGGESRFGVLKPEQSNYNDLYVRTKYHHELTSNPH